MKNLTLFLVVTIGVVFLTSLLLMAIVKADEKTVTATVTIGIVSVTVAPTSFNYGTMPFSSIKESFDIIDVSGDKNVKATVGSVLTDLDIKGADTAAWTLHQTTIGADTYVHKFSTATNGTTRPASYAGLTTIYGTLQDGVVAEGIVWFGLEMNTPSSGVGTQQSSVTTVLASFGG